MQDHVERARERARRRMEIDVLPSWYATRGRRRTLATVGLAAMAVFWADAVAAWVLAPDTRMFTVHYALLVAASVVAAPVIVLLKAATRGITSLAERYLDERQVGERLRAHSVANRITLVLIALATTGVFLATFRQGPEGEVPAFAVILILYALGMTHLILPLFVAAWRMPDPPSPDE